MEEVEQDRPVPKPRRMAVDVTKSQYENVETELIHKNRETNTEQKQINQISIVPEIEKLVDTKCDTDNMNISNKKGEITYVNDSSTSNNLKPVPAPRRTIKSECQSVDIYENTNITKSTTLSDIPGKEPTISRKAPEIPRKLGVDCQDSPRVRTESVGDYKEGNFPMTKSLSSSTLNSISSNSSSENRKYKNPSPSDLFKSLGTTSRLLSEAITERVAVKAKGAKHKIDKNLKNSQTVLSNWGMETTSRLKSVGKKVSSLGMNNFSLTRQEHRSSDIDDDRPKTMPAGDEVFQSISFNSPFNKAINVSDLSRIESSYEIPRTIKSPCPSYDEAMGNNNKFNFERNTNRTKSLASHKFEESGITLVDFKNKSDTNLNESTKYEDNEVEDSLPMPNYPPPKLHEDPIYGQVKQVQPPMRPKRRKNYERVDIKTNNCTPPASNRATVDSFEFRNAFENSSREVSIEIQEVIKQQEKLTQNPERSESWSYYDGNDEDSSSPEPIYANHEITYGKLCEMESKEVNLPLTPEVKSPHKFLFNSVAIGKEEKPVEPDILHEFDPLIGKNLAEFTSVKSNQLLLLEHLLEEDTYGVVTNDNSILDNQSIMGSSDEENDNVAASLPIPPQRMDSLQHSDDDKQDNDIRIIRENSNLPITDHLPAVDEVLVQKYLARVDENSEHDHREVDLARPVPSRSNWFVEEACVNQAKCIKPSNINVSIPTDKVAKKTFPMENDPQAPPTYAEAMSTVTNSFTLTEPPFSIPTKETQSKSSVKSMFSNVFNKMDALTRKKSFSRSSRSSDTRIVLEMIPKPTLSQRLVRFEGPLIRFPSGVVEDILKEMQNRKAILRDRKFQTFQDQEMKNQKECFSLEYITTIQCVSNNKITDSSTHLYCFEITTSLPKNHAFQQAFSNPNVVLTNNNSGNSKLQRICHLYGVGKESERDIWMQKLIESLTSVFPTNYTCQYYRAGWCYLKNSITSQWSGTWLLLKKRKRRLVFYSDADMNLEKMDLRKARCIVLKEADDSIKNLHVESGPTIMIDCPPYTVYLIMSSPRETKIWRHIIKEVAHNNGPLLSEQQLTKFNVPVIVDKCINFVYIHGCMSEGIYRKSGSENSIQKLLSQFRTDAFNVEITRSEYNEHDVANVLKRFMRDLPQRLLGKHSVSFVCVTEIKLESERISCYKDLLERLPDVEYQTLKKIVGHLAFIHSQKSKNKMSVSNLAMIWGPTLLQSEDEEMMTYSQKEADVIAQLILLYKNLFPLTTDEIRKEQEILQYLRKYYAAAENLSDSIKKSGDLKVWITIDVHSEHKDEEKNQANVSLNPNKTVYDVCKELSAKIKIPVHQLTLHEVILDETMDRPLHHNEKVFDIVLRWSYWPEADRKNNHLVLKSIEVLKEVERALKNLPTVTPGKELKFADSKSKHIKSFHVELRDGRILVTKKEKNIPVLVREICLRNVITYLGCEKKRDFQWGWSITLIEKNSKTVLRSRDLPYIGHVIGGNVWEDRIIWFSVIWNSIYGDDILPPPEIIIK